MNYYGKRQFPTPPKLVPVAPKTPRPPAPAVPSPVIEKPGPRIDDLLKSVRELSDRVAKLTARPPTK